jgi:peptidoglycan/LPS O-acetylase OafA/YrhL
MKFLARMKPGGVGLRAVAESEKLITLEIARFVAAFCVGTNHIVSFAASLSTGPILHGFNLPPITSVLFFFVLSGFVIYTAHQQDIGHPGQIPRYFWRRLCRIFPLYWLSLSIPLYYLWSVSSPHYLIKMFTLAPYGDRMTELVPPAWSLRFELAFYLMFGLIMLPLIGRVVLAGWALLWAWHSYPTFPPFSLLVWQPRIPYALGWHFFGPHDVHFFAGLAAGFAFARLRPRPWLLWSLLALSVSALIFLARLDEWGFGYPPVGRAPFVGASFAVIIFALAALERARAIRPRPRLAALGAMSYPFYLFHPAVIYLCGVFVYFHPQYNHFGHPYLVFGAMMTASLILSALVTYLYDRPVQRMLRRLYPRRQPARRAAA